MTPQGFVERFGGAGPEPGEGARLAAISFEVSELSALQSRLTEAGIPALRRDDAVVVAPENSLGATLLFTPAG